MGNDGLRPQTPFDCRGREEDDEARVSRILWRVAISAPRALNLYEGSSLARSLAPSSHARAARRPRQSTSSYSPRLEATAEGRAGFRAPRRGFTQPSGLSFAEPCVFGKRLEARPSRPALRKIHRFIPNNKGGGAATELSRMVVAHYHTWVSPKPKGQEVMRGGTVQVDRNRKQWQGLPLFSCIITASQEGKQKEADRGTCVCGGCHLS